MVRAFIAIRILADDIVEQIQSIIRMNITENDSAQGKVKLSYAKHPHITLFFLGNITEQDIKKIKDAINSKLKEKPSLTSFKLSIGNIGFFPSFSKQRVLWLGLSSADGAIIKLKEFVDERIADCIGCNAEKKNFRPHVTIARIKQGKITKDVVKQIEDYIKKIKPKTYAINSFSLFKSTLTPQGPVYEELARFKL